MHSSFHFPSDESSDSDSNSDKQDTTPGPTEQRVFLVFESSLLSLFVNCPTCGQRASTNTLLYGTLVVVKMSCPDDHEYTWYSQPLVGKAGAGNLLLSAAIVFSGATYTTFANIASSLNLVIFSEQLFYKIQQTRIFPLVTSYYHKTQIVIAELLRENGPLILSGNGRCDSSGYSAKYCTYSLMDNVTGFTVDYSLVQVTETGTSVAMEKEGLQRCLANTIDGLNLDIATLATDRQSHITAFMRTNYPNIKHQFDVWHLAKSVTKKLGKVGQQKGHTALLPWIRSISNHLWWSAKTCNGDPDLLVAKWTSIVHHIVNVHEWDSDKFSHCAHEPIDNTCDRKKWLIPNDPAHRALKQIVTKPKLVIDIAKLSDFCHTGQLEVFHSLLTKYCPKRQHFSYMGMNVRMQLAILDHNYNIERQQATTLQGQARFKQVFPKSQKRWVAKAIKEDKKFDYLVAMLEEVVSPDYKPDELSSIFTPDLPPNIALVPCPPLDLTVQEQVTRFSK